jgi:hypothetical protein
MLVNLTIVSESAYFGGFCALGAWGSVASAPFL